MSNPLLSRLATVYGQPDSHDPAAYLAELAKMLVKYSPAELEAAGDLVLRTHRSRAYPTPAVVATACEEVRKEASPRAHAGPVDRYPEWSPTAFRNADRLIRSAMGQVAARDGWILGLHDFCRHNGRLPDQSEIGAIKECSAFLTACRRCTPNELGFFGAALSRFCQTMLERRRELAQAVLGEVLP